MVIFNSYVTNYRRANDKAPVSLLRDILLWYPKIPTATIGLLATWPRTKTRPARWSASCEGYSICKYMQHVYDICISIGSV